MFLQEVRARARLRAHADHLDMFDLGGELPIFTGNVRTSSSPLWCSLSCCAREEGSGLGEWGAKKETGCARTGATGDSAHRAYLLQRVIRGVEVFDILFARVRYRNAIAGGQRERSRGGKNARRVGGEVTTFDEPRDSGLGVFFVSAARSLARTLWMSFFFGFRSPYFALSFSSCCRMISSGEGWRGGGVEGFGSGSV